MKYLTAILLASILFLTGCNSEGDNSSKSSSNFSKNIDLPVKLCDYITKEMVVSHFDVSIVELELKDDSGKVNGAYAECGYAWKKPNYDEIQAKRTDMMMAYAMKGLNKNDANAKEVTMSDITKLESPNNIIKIGHFKEYKDNKTAVRSFENSHRVPSKEDMKKLHKEIDKKGDQEGLDEKSKKLGKGLTDGIGSSLKFTKVDGVGDQAYFDHLSRALDVRFGTYSFSVFIDTDLDFETNMAIAKKIANEVWDKL